MTRSKDLDRTGDETVDSGNTGDRDRGRSIHFEEAKVIKRSLSLSLLSHKAPDEPWTSDA